MSANLKINSSIKNIKLKQKYFSIYSLFDFSLIKFYNILQKNINSSFEYMITHYHFLFCHKKYYYFWARNLTSRANCYSCT